MIVYVREQGAVIHRSGHTLVVQKEDLRRTVFVHRLEQLVVLGNVTLTNPALTLLCREGVDTLFLTRGGRYKGRLEGAEGKNVFLAKRQFDSLDDREFGLWMARRVVAGKLANMATLAGRLKRRSRSGHEAKFEGEIAGIREQLRKTESAGSVEILRGYEGMGTRHFYAAFRLGLKGDWGFQKRVRRPPTDPVNSVLSLLYTLLFNRVHTAVRIAGLHPMVGYLHSLDYGRHSLVLDLMEEFRSLVAETTTLSLFNLKILGANDFYREEPPAPEPETQARPHVTDDPIGRFYENSDDGFFDVGEQRIEETAPLEHEPSEKRPCRLTPDALKRVLEAFEEKIDTEFTHPLTGAPVSYAEAMVAQARHFRAVLEGEQDRYLPLQLK